MFPAVLNQMRQQAQALLDSEGVANAVTMELLWREVVVPPGYDPNDESTAAGATVTDRTLEFRALFHTVDSRLSGYQRFMEIQTGDVILDYLADLDLATKPDPRLRIKGTTQIYTQKSAGTALKESWDLTSTAGGLFKTLLLSPAG